MKRSLANRGVLLAIVLCAAQAFAETPALARSEARSPVTARAYRILEGQKETLYQHTTEIDEAAGKYYCDCSGLIGWILRKELPEHYKAVPHPAKVKRPRAAEFHDAFAAAPAAAEPGKLWRRIGALADARPGDLIAWRKDPLPATGSTGHIVLLDSVPRQVRGDVWEATVIDSTTLPHKDDTRAKGQTGVGRGTMYFKVDEKGHPVARSPRSIDGPFTPYPHAIGRPVIEEKK